MLKIRKIGALTLIATCFLTATPINPSALAATYNEATVDIDKDDKGNTTYRNNANGKTYTVHADGTKTGDSDYAIKSLEVYKNETVEVGNYKDIQLYLPYGQTSISNLKIKKGKKVIAAKIVKKVENKNQRILCGLQSDGNYYYRDRVTGNLVSTGLIKSFYTSFTDYTIRIYGKKLGKASFEYTVNGNTTYDQKINIKVAKTDNPIVSATLGGKSLLLDYSKGANNKKYIYYDGTRMGRNYTTLKGGKLKIKLGSNYKLRAIYLEKNIGYEMKQHGPGEDYTGQTLDPIKRPIDLNGDGDYNDTIDGFSESKASMYYFEKVKNGQKIKLDNQATYKDWFDMTDKTGSGTYSKHEKNDRSRTDIYVVYQDKRDGSVDIWHTSLYRILK